LQKVWLQGDFDRARAVTTSGERVEIMSTGKWNLLGGPDFLGARLTIGGRVVAGDVEVHFHGSDWAAHNHRPDPAYAGVVLHVVLFPPGPHELPARNHEGAVIPTLVLMPLLLRDLEEYASDDALERITARDEWRNVETLARLPAGDLRALLVRTAEQRWRQKVGYARTRLHRLGWEEAAHHTALEILGYRFNRAPMLMLAARHPLGGWTGSDVEARALFSTPGLSWHLQGVRPANHPLARLRQYTSWVAARPDWPARLHALAASLPAPAAGDVAAATKKVRAAQHFPALRERMRDGLLARAVGGTRLDNLICDGFLPLLAARLDRDLFSVWFHWWPGDVPPQIRLVLRTLGQTGTDRPYCHGLAQGFLGWRLGQEICASI
jgi:hypothetical protein